MFDLKWEPGAYTLDRLNGATHRAFETSARHDENELAKALVTGPGGIVASGATGGQALKYQFLHDKLERVSFSQDDAKLMKLIPKKKVYSDTIEWTSFLSYGGPGHGFTTETGTAGVGQSPSGQFGAVAADDNYVRQTALIKYMVAAREISLASTLVKNIADPEKTAEDAMTLELTSKMNTAGYWADAGCNANAYNGIPAQLISWVQRYPWDQSILFDAGGQSFGEDLLNDIVTECRLKYGNPSMFLMSTTAYNDTMKSLFPKGRYTEGTGGSFGTARRTFMSANGGEIHIEDDMMLRRGRPLGVEGNPVTGRARTVNTADNGFTAFASTPWTNSTPAAVNPGVGNWFTNANRNTDAGALGTVPALPTGAGNQSNHLSGSATTGYYAVSYVNAQGLEGPAWVAGCASAGIIDGSITALAIAAGKEVQIDIDCTTPAITGFGTSIPRATGYFRVYQCTSLTGTAPTSLAQFGYLMDIGVPQAGNARGYDNGMYIPHSDNAFLLTEKKNGQDGWFLGQLLPMIKRPLPHYLMGEPLGMLAFVTLILWVCRHHIWVRNVGQFTNNGY